MICCGCWWRSRRSGASGHLQEYLEDPSWVKAHIFHTRTTVLPIGLYWTMNHSQMLGWSFFLWLGGGCLAVSLICCLSWLFFDGARGLLMTFEFFERRLCRLIASSTVKKKKCVDGHRHLDFEKEWKDFLELQKNSHNLLHGQPQHPSSIVLLSIAPQSDWSLPNQHLPKKPPSVHHPYFKGWITPWKHRLFFKKTFLLEVLVRNS